MEPVVDRDQKWLLDCLSATLDTSRDIRSFAEASLQQASSQPGWLFYLITAIKCVSSHTGFGAALSKIMVNKEISFGLPVLLKQFIKQHWQEDEENFVHPVISPEEKVLKCLLQFVQNISNLSETQLSGKNLGTLWSNENLSYFLFEFLLTIVGNSRLKKVHANTSITLSVASHSLDCCYLCQSGCLKVIGRDVKELVYYTIAFLQITEEQLQEASLFALVSLSEQLIEAEMKPYILYSKHFKQLLRQVLFAFQVIKNAPGCLQPLVSRILPPIRSVLEKVSFIY
ncbi:hypothetical protein BHE74_00009020 [Ensete ventricosum]|nr:hypothetical protein GW17_00030815 [Ensete ventricosum]RWW82515.1 hypothetical protein BHE74_00009020 [Ensete ventricosum]